MHLGLSLSVVIFCFVLCFGGVFCLLVWFEVFCLFEWLIDFSSGWSAYFQVIFALTRFHTAPSDSRKLSTSHILNPRTWANHKCCRADAGSSNYTSFLLDNTQYSLPFTGTGFCSQFFSGVTLKVCSLTVLSWLIHAVYMYNMKWQMRVVSG